MVLVGIIQHLCLKNMKIREEKAYGVILIAQGQFLLVKNKDFKGKDPWWGFAKGHQESNETELEAALRELEEETGVKLDEKTVSEIETKKIISENYSYLHPSGTKVNKKNYYFVAKVDKPIETTPDYNEIIETKWTNDIGNYLKNNTLTKALEAYI